MNLQWNIETYITLTAVILSILGSYLIIRLDWKRYGLVFILAGIVGNILCYIFVKLGFYSFPYRLFPHISVMPFETILTIFPLIVLIGIRYSPRSWLYKIPFYWVIVHLGMLGETLAQNFTRLISYDFHWDFWDSYTWWWFFLLAFDYIGGLIVPEHLRKPLNFEHLRYPKLGCLFIHFVLIVTIFLGGYYLGTISR